MPLLRGGDGPVDGALRLADVPVVPGVRVEAVHVTRRVTHRHVYAAALAASLSAEAHAIATGADGLITDCCRALIGPRFGVRWWLAGGWMIWFGGHLLFRWPA